MKKLGKKIVVHDNTLTAFCTMCFCLPITCTCKSTSYDPTGSTLGHPENAIYADTSYPYSERELEVFRILSMDYAYSKDIMNEIGHMEDSLESVRDMKFPETVPVLQFVSGDNCELLETWEMLHREVITETNKSEMLRLDGGHYLHFERKQELVEKVREWVRSVEEGF